MTDKLKELALECKKDRTPWWWDAETFIEHIPFADAAFIAAASPDAILALIKRAKDAEAEVERLTEQCKLFDAAAFKAKVEAKTLVDAAEARVNAIEGQEPIGVVKPWGIKWSETYSGHRRNVDAKLYLASGAAPKEDLIPPDDLFVCGQMGAHVTRVYTDAAPTKEQT